MAKILFDKNRKKVFPKHNLYSIIEYNHQRQVNVLKIEKINKDRIVVTLSPTDLSDYNIDINALGPNSKELHSLLFNIMEMIRDETGFNPYNGQVVVEATPFKDGVTLGVSKMGAAQRLALEEFKRSVKVTARLKSPEKREKTRYVVFRFSEFDNACMSLKRLTDEILYGGALYRLDKAFCLAMRNEDEYRRSIDLVNEFADEMSYNPLKHVFVKEHGSLIAEGEELVEMARHIRSLT